MNIRQKMNENPGIAIAVTVGGLILFVVVILWEFRTPPRPGISPIVAEKGFFSDDDGKTWFIDNLKNVPPYTHNGKTAYRAQLFITDDQTVFVGYLESYDPPQKAKVESEIQNGKAPSMAVYENVPNIKKPGSSTWAKMRPNGVRPVEYNQVLAVSAPGNTKQIVHGPVRVTQKDVQAAGSS